METPFGLDLQLKIWAQHKEELKDDYEQKFREKCCMQNNKSDYVADLKRCEYLDLETNNDTRSSIDDFKTRFQMRFDYGHQEPEKACLLRVVMGPQAVAYLQSLPLSKEEKSSADGIFTGMEKHLFHSKDVELERKAFQFARKLKSDETYMDYSVRLLEMVQLCDYDQDSEILVRDKLFTEVPELQTRADIAQQWDLRQATTFLDAILDDGPTVTRRSTATAIEEKSAIQRGSCKNCGASIGHEFWDQCPAAKAVCGFCSKPEHLKIVCKKKAKSLKNVDVKDHYIKADLLTRMVDIRFVKSKTDIVTIKCGVNTTASCNVMDEHQYRSTFSEFGHPMPTQSKIMGPNGKLLVPVGVFYVDCVYERNHQTLMFFIVPDFGGQPILSYPDSRTWGIEPFTTEP